MKSIIISQLEKASRNLKFLVTLGLISAVSASCSKENLAPQNNEQTENSLMSTKIDQLKSEDFSAYLGLLPEAQRTPALIAYADEQKRAILQQNEAVLTKQTMNVKTESNFTTSSTPSAIDAVGYTPTIEAEITESFRWTVVAHVLDWWKVESSDKVTISNKGNITDIEHEGSQLSGTSILVSWAEGIVQKHFTTHIATVNVEGTITSGIFSNKKNGVLTINGPRTRM